MRRHTLYRLLGTGLLGWTFAGCTETPSAPPEAIDAAAARAPASCNITSTIASDTRSFFSNPERREATDSASALSSACRDGNVARVNNIAWSLLGQVDAVVLAGRGGDAAVGSRLINNLIVCTDGLCEGANPQINFQVALAPYGLFGVRTAGGPPVWARGPIAVGDTEAQWVVESDEWAAVMPGASRVILYGAPKGAGVLKDIPIGGLAYDLNIWPDKGPFNDGKLHVGTCFSGEGIDLPHQDNDNAKPHTAARLQRESVLLEVPARKFSCEEDLSPSTQQASLLSGFTRLVRDLVPTSLRRVFSTDTKVRVIGGSPLDFSTFATVGADPEGYLEMLQEPVSGSIAGQSFGTVRVRANSGAGTPMEKVEIRLTIANNSGVPAGAVMVGDSIEVTVEADGDNAGIATFTTAGVDKAGGYTICANGTLNGFTFRPACTTTVFSIRNR